MTAALKCNCGSMKLLYVRYKSANTTPLGDIGKAMACTIIQSFDHDMPINLFLRQLNSWGESVENCIYIGYQLLDDHKYAATVLVLIPKNCHLNICSIDIRIGDSVSKPWPIIKNLGVLCDSNVDMVKQARAVVKTYNFPFQQNQSTQGIPSKVHVTPLCIRWSYPALAMTIHCSVVYRSQLWHAL